MYLKNTICLVASTEARHHLHSASSADLIVPATHHWTLGGHTFAVTAPQARNGLLDAMRWISLLATFKQPLDSPHFTKFSLTLLFEVAFL